MKNKKSADNYINVKVTYSNEIHYESKEEYQKALMPWMEMILNKYGINKEPKNELIACNL